MYWTYVSIQSDIRCLIIGVFKPFTFTGIADTVGFKYTSLPIFKKITFIVVTLDNKIILVSSVQSRDTPYCIVCSPPSVKPISITTSFLGVGPNYFIWRHGTNEGPKWKIRTSYRKGEGNSNMHALLR